MNVLVDHNYFVYILTNPKRSVLYTGVTNNIANRLQEHFELRGQPWTFAGKYYCFNLIYYEQFSRMEHAIDREKQIKGWTRVKKISLIAQQNPQWKFLNAEVVDL
jgi:putative endonuclease